MTFWTWVSLCMVFVHVALWPILFDVVKKCVKGRRNAAPVFFVLTLYVPLYVGVSYGILTDFGSFAGYEFGGGIYLCYWGALVANRLSILRKQEESEDRMERLMKENKELFEKWRRDFRRAFANERVKTFSTGEMEKTIDEKEETEWERMERLYREGVRPEEMIETTSKDDVGPHYIRVRDGKRICVPDEYPS